MGFEPDPAAVADLLPACDSFPTTPDGLRDIVPATENDVAYFNTGASGPCPEPVLEAVTAFHRAQKSSIPTGEWTYELGFGAYELAREAAAAHFGVAPEEIALTGSTADGLSAVAAALELGPGDVVVRTDLEHPAGTLPWAALRRRHGIEVRIVGTEEGRIDVDAFGRAVADADVACFSSLSWNYGTRLPVRDLVTTAKEAGAFTIVDAVQEPGHGPLDLRRWGADAVAASGHKWLLGPWGSGILYVNRAAATDLRPPQVTYRGVAGTASDPADYEPAAGAKRFERGTAAPAPYVGLRTAIELFESIGLSAVADRNRSLATRLVEALPDDRVLSPADPESGLVTVAVDNPASTVDTLADAGIAIRTLPEPDAVRASVHAFNSPGEVDRLAAALTDSFA